MHAWLKKTLAITMMAGAMALAPVADADAALNAQLELKGQKTGKLKASGAKRGKSAGIEVLAFTHEIRSPRDSATGQATGKRQHKPFKVTVEFDTQIIAILIGLIQSGESLDGTLSFTSAKKKGGKEAYLTYELKDVKITSYQVSSTTGGDDVIILELSPKSYEAKTADGKVFASSDAAAVVSHKSATKQ